MTDKHDDQAVPPSASMVEDTAQLLRNAKVVTISGEHATREHAKGYMDAWMVIFASEYAGVTLTDEQSAEAVSVVRGLESGYPLLNGFVSACEGRPLLAELAAAIKARPGATSRLLSRPADEVEIDLKSVVDACFDSGNGVLTFGADTPDPVIVLAIRTALAAGKPFTVIPV
ncbi:hypothetical protein [Paraburkholderia sp. SIMBA_054]|uniref:hypothetical protein n=1 Tax=Paraburkholderia sp. SIMBA_054 TaxID=3085795 RepID=UPI00397880BD